MFLSSFNTITAIAYLVINLLLSYVDVYTEAVVISMCKPKNKPIDRKCLQRFRGNNQVKEDIRSRYAKYVFFFARKGKQHDREPSPFWPFY